MKETHNKEVDKSTEESVEKMVARKATAFENQKTFGSERNELVGQAILRKTERDSANAR